MIEEYRFWKCLYRYRMPGGWVSRRCSWLTERSFWRSTEEEWQTGLFLGRRPSWHCPSVVTSSHFDSIPTSALLCSMLDAGWRIEISTTVKPTRLGQYNAKSLNQMPTAMSFIGLPFKRQRRPQRIFSMTHPSHDKENISCKRMTHRRHKWTKVKWIEWLYWRCSGQINLQRCQIAT